MSIFLLDWIPSPFCPGGIYPHLFHQPRPPSPVVDSSIGRLSSIVFSDMRILFQEQNSLTDSQSMREYGVKRPKRNHAQVAALAQVFAQVPLVVQKALWFALHILAL